MTLAEIKTASLVELSKSIDKADNKAELNMIIYELACRTYVPFSGVNFDDLLLSYGYKPPVQNKKSSGLTK